MINLNKLDMRTYEEFKENLFTNLMENFDECRNMMSVEVSDGTVELQLNHLLMNLILLRPFYEFNREIKKEDILDCHGFTSKKFDKRLQFIVDEFYEKELKIEVNECIASIIEETNYLTMNFNPLIGQSIDIYSLAKLATRHERFDELIHTKVDVNTQSFDEIETFIQDRFEEALDIIKKPENETCFSQYIRCGEGLNMKQLRQYMINIGLKPTLSGDVHPIPVNANFLTGFNNSSDYYIDAAGGRKAAIINSDEVKESGYMARRLTLATINTLLSDVDDCHSPNYLRINLNIEDEKLLKVILSRIIGRYANVDGEEIFITEENCNSLKGKMVLLHSPITCALEKGICKKCYGHLSELNNDIHIGKLGVDILSSQLTQTLLSSKHLLDTKSEKIVWSKNFLQIFKVNSNLISPSREFTSTNNITLLIDREDINLEDYMYNNKNDNSVFINKLSFIYKGKKVALDLPKTLYPSPELIDYLKSAKLDEERENYIIEMMQMPEDRTMFYFSIENNELSSHLYRLQDLIVRKDHLGAETIEQLMEVIYDVLAKSGLHIDLVHIENLVRELIKDPNTKQRPDFSRVITDSDYQIFTLDNSILYNPGLVVGLAFEKVAKQLNDPITYKKDQESFLDHIFM